MDNGEHGVLIMSGVAADLTGAQLLRNGWNGLRVESTLLLEEPTKLERNTALISIAGASITGNGHKAETPAAEDEDMHRFGMVVERTRKGKSRGAAIRPELPVPPAPPAGVAMHGNTGGAWAYWRDQ